MLTKARLLDLELSGLSSGARRDGHHSTAAALPLCLPTDADEKAFESFESEVIDVLFALNAKRADEGRNAGAASEPKVKGGKRAVEKKEPEDGSE